MKNIDLNNITSKDLVDHANISEAFKNYLKTVLGYDESEANFVVATDFKCPYDTPFIMQDFEGVYAVDGKEYEVRSCHTDFCACGLFHLAGLPPFEFYMLFDLETMPNQTVGSYRNARTKYLV